MVTKGEVGADVREMMGRTVDERGLKNCEEIRRERFLAIINAIDMLTPESGLEVVQWAFGTSPRAVRMIRDREMALHEDVVARAAQLGIQHDYLDGAPDCDVVEVAVRPLLAAFEAARKEKARGGEAGRQAMNADDPVTVTDSDVRDVMRDLAAQIEAEVPRYAVRAVLTSGDIEPNVPVFVVDAPPETPALELFGRYLGADGEAHVIAIPGARVLRWTGATVVRMSDVEKDALSRMLRALS